MNPLRIAVIVASTREGRFGPVVARWFNRQAAARPGLVVDPIDLAEVRMPDILSGEPPEAVAVLARRLSAADAFVVVTPEYNHSFPAALKNAIDWLRAEWSRKPVGFVSYAGVSGGIRAVEQLKQIFSALEAMPLEGVAFPGAQAAFDAEGNPLAAARAARAAAALLDRLVWWGHALREARSRDLRAAAAA